MEHHPSGIGLQFPVRGAKFDFVPWGTVEAHREALQKACGGRTLEFLAANGGLHVDTLKALCGLGNRPDTEKDASR